MCVYTTVTVQINGLNKFVKLAISLTHKYAKLGKAIHYCMLYSVPVHQAIHCQRVTLYQSAPGLFYFFKIFNIMRSTFGSKKPKRCTKGGKPNLTFFLLSKIPPAQVLLICRWFCSNFFRASCLCA